MHKKFDSGAIEKKWQEIWDEQKLYEVGERDPKKEKEYLLVEWPYPSGNLHIGHWYAFAVPDIYARFRRMTGKQVLFPMGFDAFGLPAENAAIKRKLDPKAWTYDNIAYMREQLRSMGNMFAWDKTTSSTDTDYYRWTQWMFTEFFKNDIAYRGKGVVNWCPGCNTVIANEQVLADGTCERSGDTIEKREMPQWMLRITKYADRLTDDLDALDWPEHIKEAQRQWIGRSRGAEIDFTLSTGDNVTVFTTRPDTLFGATYLVLAPEHALVQKLQSQINNWSEVETYVKQATQKDEQDRLDATKEKTGVKLEGITAKNPASGEDIPVFVADYVLGGYGTGAIMAVPAHDERDGEFAEKFSIPVRQVVRKVFGQPLPNPVPRTAVGALVYNPKTDKYLAQYSHEFNNYSYIFGGLEEGETYDEAAVRETLEETGYKTKFIRYISEETEAHFYHPGKDQNRALTSRRVLLELVDDTPVTVASDELKKQEPIWLTRDELAAKFTIEEDLYTIKQLDHSIPYTGTGTLCNSGEFDGMDSEEAKEKITAHVGGRVTSTYRLRDWSIGRQRYWGVPIPIVYSPEGVAHPVPAEHLPWTLPEDVDPTPTGVAPLAKSEELKRRTESIFGPGWTPEVETMDTFVDSSWYFLRYIDNQNDTSLSNLDRQKEWMPIDIYFGGAEHTTMHLLYSRFWQKALYDLGLVADSEPYRRRVNRGLILGPDGNKMSKSKGNVIDPDEQVRFVGADTVKMYLAFMGPYEGNNYPWDMGGIAGVRRFLERVYGLTDHVVGSESADVTRQLHKTIIKVSADIAEYKFNTAISAMMIFVNLAEKAGLAKASYELFVRTLAPFAPHLTEEIWHELGHDKSIHLETYPVGDSELARDTEIVMGVQVNGKLRGNITISPEASEEEALALAMEVPTIAAKVADGERKKVIYIAGKILNIVVS
jgi:leucyl-tRNA synthetase